MNRKLTVGLVIAVLAVGGWVFSGNWLPQLNSAWARGTSSSGKTRSLPLSRMAFASGCRISGVVAPLSLEAVSTVT